jgi:hypothetical protein
MSGSSSSKGLKYGAWYPQVTTSSSPDRRRVWILQRDIVDLLGGVFAEQYGLAVFATLELANGQAKIANR